MYFYNIRADIIFTERYYNNNNIDVYIVQVNFDEIHFYCHIKFLEHKQNDSITVTTGKTYNTSNKGFLKIVNNRLRFTLSDLDRFYSWVDDSAEYNLINQHDHYCEQEQELINKINSHIVDNILLGKECD